MQETDDQTTDLAHADVGIVCALAIEMRPFLDRCQRLKKYVGGRFVFRGGFFGDARVVIVESGMGFARARDATLAMLDAHTPTWVLACGFAGALQPEMKVGDIVIARRIIDTHGQAFEVQLKMDADPARGLHVGTLLTADHLIRTVAEKKQLAERYGAIAADVESLAVAQVCRDRKKPFMAVRAISDDMSADLPPEVLTVVGDTGVMRFGAAVGAVWKRPGSVRDILRLRESAHRAADRLAKFLEGVVTQLYETIPELSERRSPPA
ncbi:MAG: 5'-methylthioadenosine nucleosidase [Planctomycetes bacterium]|nr:5'-methylthioadenosine nucleosidase [Planctomycetota bacterium]